MKLRLSLPLRRRRKAENRNIRVQNIKVRAAPPQRM